MRYKDSIIAAVLIERERGATYKEIADKPIKDIMGKPYPIVKKSAKIDAIAPGFSIPTLAIYFVMCALSGFILGTTVKPKSALMAIAICIPPPIILMILFKSGGLL